MPMRKAYLSACVGLLLGCNSILGIEDRPLRLDEGGSGSDATIGGSGNVASAGTANNGGKTGVAGSHSDGQGGVSAGGTVATAGATNNTGGGSAGGITIAGSNSGGSNASGHSSTGGDASSGGAGAPNIDPQLELADAIKNLNGFKFINPCDNVGHDISACQTSDVCFPNAGQIHVVENLDIAIGGIAGHTYEIKLRLRGLLEPRDYPAGCKRVTSTAGADIAIMDGCDGFANVANVTFNIFELKVQNPSHTYYLNGVPIHPPHRVDNATLEWTIQVAGKTTITFTFDDLNGGQNRYCGEPVQGVPVSANGGQALQLTVLETKLVN